ncbi:MAG TPA: Yip1 family protein [Caulobacteraceae bacterium]|nr:Yip1 family protein [Caulobacteraceae bacterium]
MTVVEGPRSAGLMARVQGILIKPAAEWDVIEAEPATIPGLFTGYACILAAIPPIALILQHLLFIHWTIIPIIVIAVLSYVVSLIGVFIMGFIIDALAPSFDGQKNSVQAMKLAVYPYTAAWVAGILNIVPILGILAILAALYGLYILYLGLPKLMKCPPEKTMGYFIVSLVVALVVNIVIGMIIGSITVMMTAGALLSGANAITQSGYQNGDLARLEAASRQMAIAGQAAAGGAAASQTANGKAVAAIDPEKLKSFLPDTAGGLPRTELSSQRAGAAGIGASNAEAVYAKDSARITLTVTDLSAMGALAGMAGAMGVESDKQTATGYEKVGKVGGRLTTEEWDRGANSGKYGILVADRFMVQAEGSGTTIDALKSAVAAVGPDRLEGLART